MTRPYRELFIPIEIFLCAQQCNYNQNLSKRKLSIRQKFVKTFYVKILGLDFSTKNPGLQSHQTATPWTTISGMRSQKRSSGVDLIPSTQ